MDTAASPPRSRAFTLVELLSWYYVLDGTFHGSYNPNDRDAFRLIFSGGK